MSELGAVTAISASAPNKAASKASVDYDAFLQLLVTQMKSQDPTKPMDSTEYMAQLASFSNVEQAIVTNEKLDAVLNATMLSTAGNVVGRTISGPNGVGGEVAQVRLSGGSPVAILVDGSEIALSGNWTLER